MSGLYSKMSATDQERLQKYVNTRWNQLYELMKHATGESLSFTFLTNAGGAVAVLGFIGTSDAVRESTAAKLCLSFFVLGLIASGVFRAFYIRHVGLMLNAWNADTQKLYSDQISEEQMDSDDDARADSWILNAQYVAGYASFGLFILGCAAGGCSLWG